MQALSPELSLHVLELAPDAILVADLQGCVTYANAQAHSLFGREPGSLEGAPMDDFLPGALRELSAARRADYSETQDREPARPYVLTGVRSDSTTFAAEIRCAQIDAATQRFTAVSIRDVTERERSLALLTSAKQAAEEADEAKSRLLATASHDLRQPLQTLQLLNGALRRLGPDAHVDEVLEQQERALDTMSDLLHALLDVAKLDCGKLQPQIADVLVRTIFEDLRQQFASLAAVKNLELVTYTPDVCVRTDPTLLRELLQNLVANALRYTDRGRISLRCRRGEPGRVRIEVEDTGIGIPETARARIFEDFFQAIPCGDQHRGGAGLGLGIVRRLADTLGLSIQLDSVVGVGTRFSIELPASEHMPQPETAPNPEPAARPRSQRVMLVEDDLGMRTALKTYLQLDDHEIVMAASLLELDKVLERLDRPPSIVISDFHLGPDEHGGAAIERVREHYRTALPAILLTGDTTVPARYAHKPALRVLNKPVDGQRLVSVMDELLRMPLEQNACAKAAR